jgi:hypothetical protein
LLGGCPLTPDERERMDALCTQIAIEKNHHKFMALVEELNQLLQPKEHRLEDKESS